MSFTDFEYYLFLLLIFFLSQSLASKNRWIVFLLGSLSFYSSWSLYLVAVLVLVCTAVWTAGLFLEKKNSVPVLGFVGTLLLLTFVLVKKFHIFSSSLDQILFSQPTSGKMLFAVGVSFYCLQAYSYVCDVYKKEVAAEKNFFRVLAYLGFFPQLLAGPIEKFQDLSNNIRNPIDIDRERFLQGAVLVFLGLVRKVVIGDNLAELSKMGLGEDSAVQGLGLLLSGGLFWLQIYFDFSGYSYIARGSGKLLGVELSKNFDRPLAADGIASYWRRWHITFYNWMRIYVFFPMAKSYFGRRHIYLIVFLAFVLSSLWHGLTIGFLLWGVFNAVNLYLSEVIRNSLGKLSSNLKSLLLRVHLVIALSVSWLFFNAVNIEHIFSLIHRFFASLGLGGLSEVASLMSEPKQIGVALILGLFLLYEFFNFSPSNKPVPLDIAAISLSSVALILFAGTGGQFIYFGF